MRQASTASRLLLAACGILQAIIGAIYLRMAYTDAPVGAQSWNGTIVLLGELALAAAACAIVAGIGTSAPHRSWLLVLNGIGLGGLGVVQYALTRFRISFLTVALIVVAMAVSIGILELRLALNLLRGRHVPAGWSFAVAGAASFGFAVAFFALGFRWIQIVPGSHRDLTFLGYYFALAALGMLGLAALPVKPDTLLFTHEFSSPEKIPGGSPQPGRP